MTADGRGSLTLRRYLSVWQDATDYMAVLLAFLMLGVIELKAEPAVCRPTPGTFVSPTVDHRVAVVRGIKWNSS
jgi:hypothetical protein